MASARDALRGEGRPVASWRVRAATFPSRFSARATDMARRHEAHGHGPGRRSGCQGARNEYETRRPSSVPCTTACGRWSQSYQDIRSEPAAAPGPETDTVAWIN